MIPALWFAAVEIHGYGNGIAPFIETDLVGQVFHNEEAPLGRNVEVIFPEFLGVLPGPEAVTLVLYGAGKFAASERDALSPTVRLGRAEVAERDALAISSCDMQVRRSPSSLEVIATEIAHAHDVTMEALRSKRRHRRLVQARGEIARRALLEGAANLSQVARYLNRAPATISDLLQGRR